MVIRVGAHPLLLNLAQDVVFVENPTDSNNQKWRLKASRHGFSLQNGSTWKYLAIADDKAKNNTKVVTTVEEYFWQIRSNGADSLRSVHRLYVPRESFVVIVGAQNVVELYETQDGQQSSWRFENRNRHNGQLTL